MRNRKIRFKLRRNWDMWPCFEIVVSKFVEIVVVSKFLEKIMKIMILIDNYNRDWSNAISSLSFIMLSVSSRTLASTSISKLCLSFLEGFLIWTLSDPGVKFSNLVNPESSLYFQVEGSILFIDVLMILILETSLQWWEPLPWKPTWLRKPQLRNM